MRIFDGQELKPEFGKDGRTRSAKDSSSRKEKKIGPSDDHDSKQMKKISRQRPNLSKLEIRSKVSKHFKSLKNNLRKAPMPISQDTTSAPVEQKEMPKTQIMEKSEGPVNVKKLKDALSSGIVNFSDQERKILEKILPEG